ncbi:CGNR zinc finger domain-containing protein [Gordonia soli]|uniref:Zinc finger CGNR domain-containing protein n=1 Tax=Gordonia soli NBRC 108243 TaxID=1223545 RepID=M0QD80_9ACTN|nr:CGNR zinc finger domain-containing protein [Gordonia soli]GAC66374.1 hypothetical protein GS4_02_00840 [Gordonia soli NBRC 108243]
MTNSSGRHVEAFGLASVVELINEWGEVPRAVADEADAPYPEVTAALQISADDFRSRYGAPTTAALRTAADALYPLFGSDGPAMVEAIGRLLTSTALRPALIARDADTVDEVWECTRAADRLVAGAVLSIVEHLRFDGDVTRLGVCSGDDCADVYVDLSPARRRRFCSVTCQNRNRARSYRRARAEHGDS